MGVRFLKVSVIYFILAMGLGLYMSLAGDHTLTGVHVHVNLIGWLSLAVSGIVYVLFPKADHNGWAKAQFWLMNVGLIIMMGALIALLATGSGMPWGPIVGAGGILIILGALCFVINLYSNVRIADIRHSTKTNLKA
ncbi:MULTISPECIES: cytochrome-c oxidase [unclassified Paenibacillus]|uniref:cytochrome-c oxidase n=1 Tax=unclassified Paenibacillus TaxID=185978 RepID=UPI001C127114|nr:MULTISPECIES: cytochrome-c oxidase [unclassified Paenibacillus]MBU5444012.1 cytochrome-c oxidase [Paenibacillus sp. MSJ-34]CAH0118793.1 hypothetical protein PAE9249_01288 [Paenibacillus sp. CECT 9249]